MICRRGALIAVVLAVLASSPASAGSRATFKGAVSADENSRVVFQVVKNDSGRRRVDVPKAKRLNATCDSGPREIDVLFGAGLKSAKVGADGSFDFDNSGTTPGGEDYVAYVRGRITGKSATGVLRYQGKVNFPDGPESCETSEVKWDAEKV